MQHLLERSQRGSRTLQSFQYGLNTLVYLSLDSVGDLLDTILSLGCNIFNAQSGAVVYGKDGAQLEIAAGFGVAAQLDPCTFHLQKGLIGAAAAERVPILVEKWEDRPDLKGLERPGFVEPPFVMVTIDIQDTVRGVFIFSDSHPGLELKDVEQSHYQLFSGIAALAISNCESVIRARELAGENRTHHEALEKQNLMLEDQMETVRIQQEEILRIGTPVVTLWEKVLCLPLIGVLDSQRAQQAMETLLNRIIEDKARFAIVDITGIPMVDSLVANHLAQAMAGVKLIGAEGILTGISPLVAQTLVKMGIDITGIATKRSLADGLKWALKRLSQSENP